MAFWFSSTRAFFLYFLAFFEWSSFWVNFVEGALECSTSYFEECYDFMGFCYGQCPTLWDVSTDGLNVCIEPDATKRLIFNFQTTSSIIGDSNSPNIYTFTGPDIINNPSNLPTPGYQRGLYFANSNQILSKKSGSFYLSFYTTWIFWAKIEAVGYLLRKMDINSDFTTYFKVSSIWGVSYRFEYARKVCKDQMTSYATLSADIPNNSDWNLLKIEDFEKTGAYRGTGHIINLWINNTLVSSSDVTTIYYFLDEANNYDLSIGGITGWIYEFIYIPTKDNRAWPGDYIENFFNCPKSLGACLISCKVNEFYDETTDKCVACDSNCNYCLRSGYCGLCNKNCEGTCKDSGIIDGCDANFCPADAVMNKDTCICNDNTFYYDDNLNICVKCGMYLTNNDISAGFSYDYLKILFNFTVSSAGSTSGCSNLFDNSVSLTFGLNPRCEFNADFSQLLITLGSNYKAGDSAINFKSGALKTKKNTCLEDPIQLSMPISLPLNSPTPKIIMIAPPEILTSCQSLIFSGITDPGLSYEEYSWNFFSDDLGSIISTHSTPYSSKFESVTIPQNILNEGTITASLFIKNPFKVIEKTQKIILNSTPKIVINFDSLIPKTISRLNSYSLSISSIWACSEFSENLKISWSITSVSNNLTSIDERSLWENNKSSNIQLIIPPKVLPGLTEITFHVHGYDYMSDLEGDADFTIKTDSNAPVILFNRTDGQIGVNQQLIVDGSSSYDPDGAGSTMLYQWVCITNSIGCSNFIQDSTSKKLTVPENSLSIGEIYNFTLTINKVVWGSGSLIKTSSKFIIIYCIQESVPEINIYEITQYFGRPNSNWAYRLGIKEVSSTTKILWSSIKGPSIDVATPLSSAALAIKEGSLIQGQSYTLQVFINDKFPFTWSFNVNRNPSDGYLKIIPDSGIEMNTIFTIAALDWTDPDGDFPLQYSFGYHINNIFQALNAKNLISILYSQFPYSHKDIIIYANIYDSLSAKISANFKISLSLQQDLNTDEAVYNITQQIFSPATPPSSIPLYVSQIAELSPNRQYILENNYSQINQSIQNSYDIALNAIFHYTDSMNPYDPDSAEAVGTMLNSITQNPHISTLDNIKRVDDAIGNLQAKIYGKSNLHDEEIQTLVDVSNNIFQIKSDFLENQTDSIKEVDNTMSKINAMALESMVVHEQNDFFSERIESKVSIQYTDDLKNFTETVKNSSIILSHNINDFLYKKPLVGTSFINYDPIPSEENATLSIISFNLIDLSTSTPIPLNNISNQTIILSASNFDPEKIWSSPYPPNKSSQNSTSSNGTIIYTLNCSYLEDNDWKTEHCKLESYNKTNVKCKCTRLGIFTAMVKAIWISFADNNAGDIIDASALLDIDWDNAIGLYFCVGILVFHSILSMKTLKMDWLDESIEDFIDTENPSNPIVRPDESIVNYYLRNQTNENNVTVAIEDTKSDDLKAKENNIYQYVGVKSVLSEHEFIKIFLPHKEYSHFSLATIYSTLLLGNMFFIGLFYQNNNSDTEWTFNLKELMENYDFRDFWASVYATCFTFVLGIILNYLAKMEEIDYESMEDSKIKNVKRMNKIKSIIFYLLSYWLMIFFCWSIILFSVKFDFGISCKWIYNTVLNFAVDILCVAFIRIAIKLLTFWILAKIWKMIKSSKLKKNIMKNHTSIIDSNLSENQGYDNSKHLNLN
ncbi:unnamed protein product [Blepharisma stoltei]|uniref:PKD/REJ-like domain-containing protein n=1 Tax=Blepharisma stoltei TaxID=1481888 RepID=A0AAU9JTJ4_9CILI|nr:unnamed protein product [Blepharisma stoltei]